jgi:hypothetical protein
LPSDSYILADRSHLVVSYGGPGEKRYALAPETSTPSIGAQLLLEWIDSAGGLLGEDEMAPAATNPHADISCAVGANGSIAVWRPLSGDFRSSPPHLVADRHAVNLGVRCVRQGNEDFVVTLGANDGVSSARVFSVEREALVAEFVLSYDGWPVGPTTSSHISPHAIAGISQVANFEHDPARRPFVATRINGESGRWVVEHAALGEDWPPMRSIRFFSIERNDIVLSVEGATQAVRVRWPAGVSTIAFEPRAIASDNDAFHAAVLRSNTPLLSPSETRVLWLDRTGELRLERADPTADARR